MKTFSNLGCALALGALAACGNSNGSTTTGTVTGGSTTATTTSSSSSGNTTGTVTGTTSGTASATTTSSSSGTTGTSCSQGAASCATTNCCVAGYTCDANKLCIANSNGSTTSGGSTSGDPCILGSAGSTCETSFDCGNDLFCVDGGCAAPVVGATACTTDGKAPSVGKPCCESQVDAGSGSTAIATCVAFNACIESGDACTDTSDCCNGLTCDGTSKTCVAACGAYGAACTGTGFGDCCAAQGLTCTPGSIFTPPIAGSLCYTGGLASQAEPGQAGQTLACAPEALCEAFDGGGGVVECQLGALCDLWFGLDAGGGDPCSPDGLVCDTSEFPTTEFGVCAQPTFFGACIQGGPACQALTDTNTAVDCEPGTDFQLTTGLCLQPCQTAGDCVNTGTVCETQGALDSCLSNSCLTAQFFQPCPSSATDDGVCGPLPAADQNPSENFYGICYQAATVGGGPGTACSINGNRQQGGLCDNADFCNSGICGAVCNAGTMSPASPACPQGQTCVSQIGYWAAGDSQDFGSCVTPCDFTQPDGGGCGTSSAGVPTKCLPGELLDYGPSTGTPIVDMCSPLQPNAIAIGGDCSAPPTTNAIDPCVQNAMCYGLVGTGSTCLQLCETTEIGKSGPAGGCPTGYDCNGVQFTSTPSTHTGVCQPNGQATSTTTTTTSTGTTATTSGSTTATTSGAATGSTTGGTTATTGGATTGGTTTTTGASSTTSGG